MRFRSWKAYRKWQAFKHIHHKRSKSGRRLKTVMIAGRRHRVKHRRR